MSSLPTGTRVHVFPGQWNLNEAFYKQIPGFSVPVPARGGGRVEARRDSGGEVTEEDHNENKSAVLVCIILSKLFIATCVLYVFVD